MRSFPSKTLSVRPHHKAIAVVRLFAVFFCLLILQMISPLCSEMKHILQEYLRIRKGTENDYLFNADIVRDYDSHSPLSSIVKPKKSIKMN